MIKLVQFKDDTYGIRMYKWLIPGTLYWNFFTEEWDSGAHGVANDCRGTLEEAREMLSFLEDKGSPYERY